MSATQQAQPSDVTSEPDATARELAEYSSVFKIIRGWSPSLRATLITRLIDELAREAEPPRPRKSTLERARGLLSNGSPPPSDEEVERILDEYRQEKYG
jgi:hypothetical protein